VGLVSSVLQATSRTRVVSVCRAIRASAVLLVRQLASLVHQARIQLVVVLASTDVPMVTT